MLAVGLTNGEVLIFDFAQQGFKQKIPILMLETGKRAVYDVAYNPQVKGLVTVSDAGGQSSVHKLPGELSKPLPPGLDPFIIVD